MSDFSQTALVCIHGLDGTTILGAGFALPGNRILTCAHIYMQAIDQQGRQKIDLGRPVKIRFPFLPAGPMHEAIGEFVPNTWDGTTPLSMLRTLDSDFAVLHLRDPISILSAPCYLGVGISDTRFTVRGFPDGMPTPSDIVGGNVVGESAIGLLKVSGDNELHDWIKDGFSGSPVWCDELGGVVGIVVAVREMDEGGNKPRQHARVLTLRRVRDICPSLLMDEVVSYKPTCLPRARPWLLCWSADRDTQLTAIESEVNKIRSQFWEGPILLLIFGDSDQGLGEFATLLAERGLEGKPLRLVNIHCSESIENLEQLKLYLTAQLSMQLRGGMPGQGKVDLEALIRDTSLPTLLAISVSSSAIRKKDGRELSWLLLALATLFGTFRSSQQLLYLCVCLRIVPVKRRFLSTFIFNSMPDLKKVLSSLEDKLAQELAPFLRIISLPRLTSVGFHEAVEWTRKREVIDYANPNTLVSELDTLFPNASPKQIPMLELAVFLDNALEKSSRVHAKGDRK